MAPEMRYKGTCCRVFCGRPAYSFIYCSRPKTAGRLHQELDRCHKPLAEAQRVAQRVFATLTLWQEAQSEAMLMETNAEPKEHVKHHMNMFQDVLRHGLENLLDVEKAWAQAAVGKTIRLVQAEENSAVVAPGLEHEGTSVTTSFDQQPYVQQGTLCLEAYTGDPDDSAAMSPTTRRRLWLQERAEREACEQEAKQRLAMATRLLDELHHVLSSQQLP